MNIGFDHQTQKMGTVDSFLGSLSLAKSTQLLQCTRTGNILQYFDNFIGFIFQNMSIFVKIRIASKSDVAKNMAPK